MHALVRRRGPLLPTGERVKGCTRFVPEAGLGVESNLHVRAELASSMAQREQRVTPLEVFFDVVFVFAITQVTLLMSDDPTW